ncbi:MAG TPA: orotidine-5'-phosphate decarboxylase [Candidatus Paceibacterota bacterium]
MSQRDFRELLQARWDEGKFVCVGLDSELGKIPKSVRMNDDVRTTIYGFNASIVSQTKDLVCAYKINIAFYEAHGVEGIEALRGTIVDIHSKAPYVPVILDAKRADIGNTNAGYVQMAFDYLGVDAITVHPYLGQEALQPFLDRADKGIIVLCRTSNPGAGELQDLLISVHGEEADTLDHGGIVSGWVSSSEGQAPLYTHIAYQVSRSWNKNNNCALVVGATYPYELQDVRQIVGDMPILIPGIGAQGGDLEATVRAGKNSRGQGMIINSSRGIIFASSGEDFAEAARRETQKLHDAINQYR